jgi:hypothetical protein
MDDLQRLLSADDLQGHSLSSWPNICLILTCWTRQNAGSLLERGPADLTTLPGFILTEWL